MPRSPLFRLLSALARSSDPAYRIAHQELAERRGLIMLGYVGVAYPSFFALDLFVYPERSLEFAALRILHAVLGLGGLLLSGRVLGPSATLRLAQASAISATTCVGVMCAVTEGFGSLYLVGMLICFLAISTIEVFRPSQLLGVLVAISLVYVWLNLHFTAAQPRQEVAAISFVAGAILFCGISAALTEQARRELFQANTHLREKNQDLEHARALQGQFLSTVSHELRAPVNSMLGFVELVERRELGLQPKSRANLVRIKESGRRLLGFINDLLDLSKAEAGRMELQLSTFDLMSMAQEVADATRAFLLQRELPVIVVGPPSLVVRSDEHRVRQILTNLATNAAKFTESGHIVVAIESRDGVSLAVSDTGPGIAEESRQIIFEAFRQVGISAGGTGLGLSIVQRLVELLGGQIELESELGRGSTFRVRLGHIEEATRV